MVRDFWNDFAPSEKIRDSFWSSSSAFTWEGEGAGGRGTIRFAATAPKAAGGVVAFAVGTTDVASATVPAVAWTDELVLGAPPLVPGSSAVAGRDWARVALMPMVNINMLTLADLKKRLMATPLRRQAPREARH